MLTRRCVGVWSERNVGIGEEGCFSGVLVGRGGPALHILVPKKGQGFRELCWVHWLSFRVFNPRWSFFYV